ncbi:GntR family transcriptional regulator [Segeticoccus rhizosphaerae]|uniref:GntR family transcriptional regulator n=1 Tax=Segeticoccus rhizosphaerae TaxID=1104777 RepID=UPI001EF0BD8C|nr:GntR family transcriptional regulator [Segeticoccus rhizosphaerae]
MADRGGTAKSPARISGDLASDGLLDVQRPPSTQEYVLDELRRAIVTGKLPPGRPLRQETLAQWLGVSRVPLREAFNILQGEGLVVATPNRGYSVVDLSTSDLQEVYLIRQLLEDRAALEAMKTLDQHVIATMNGHDEAVQAAAAAGDILAMVTANRLFHFTLIDSAELPRISKIVRSLWDATDAYRAIYYGDKNDRERAHRVHIEHQEILAALRAKDPISLTRALDTHRDNAIDALTQLLSPDRERNEV